jgi:hypothetical protein
MRLTAITAEQRATFRTLTRSNLKIRWVKKTARGFRNVEHFKTAIHFHCGGLDLYPTHTKA